MHYTAMAGLTLHAVRAAAPSSAPALSTDLLAIVVAIVAFVVSGIFLLTLVPDRSRRAAAHRPATPELPHGLAAQPGRDSAAGCAGERSAA